MTQLRLMDLTQSEFIEIKSADLVSHLLTTVDALKAERNDRLNFAQSLIADVDEAMVFFAGYVANVPTKGKARQFQDSMHEISRLSKKINKLQSFANSLTISGVPALVRLNLEQAEEFSL